MSSLAPTSERPNFTSSGRRLVFRIPLCVVALGLGLFSALTFQHKCMLGLKWFENNAIWSFPVLFGAVSLIPKRHAIAAGAVVLLFVTVTYGLAPLYLAMVHPNGEG
jgi:hypothetical protein